MQPRLIQLTVCLQFDTEQDREAWKVVNYQYKKQNLVSLEQTLVRLVTRVEGESNETDKQILKHFRDDFQQALNHSSEK